MKSWRSTSRLPLRQAFPSWRFFRRGVGSTSKARPVGASEPARGSLLEGRPLGHNGRPGSEQSHIRPKQASVHPSSIVHPSAQMHPEATVGPFCVVGPNVKVESGCVIHSHVVLDGCTTLGARSVVYPHATLGTASEDKKHDVSVVTRLGIGEGCIIRENVTVNCGTAPERGGDPEGTQIGKGVLLQACAHVGHDCKIGDDVIISARASLAGHVHVGDRAILGGMSGVHQRVHIGTFAMVGGAAAVDGDVIPYGLASGNRAYLRGINLIGLRRSRKFTLNQVKFLIAAQRYLFPSSCHNAVRSSLMTNPLDLPQLELLDERAHELRKAIRGGIRLTSTDTDHAEPREETKLALDVLDAIHGRGKMLASA